MEWDGNQELQPEPASKHKSIYPLCPQLAVALQSCMESSMFPTSPPSGTTYPTVQLCNQLSIPCKFYWPPSNAVSATRSEPKPLLPPKPKEQQHSHTKQPFSQLNNQNPLTLTSTTPTQRNPIKMRKKSRRTTHRRKNRKIKKEITSKQKWLEHKLSQTKRYCNTSFGFYSDPNQSKRKNFNHAITTLPSNLCTQPTNLAFHNLCIKQQLPKGSKQLLGLNLSFCLTPRNFHENIKKNNAQISLLS
jgi:hypothetical protein